MKITRGIKATIALHFKLAYRNLLFLFFTICLPAGLFLLFGYLFGLSDSEGTDYAAFILPGMIALMCSSDGLYNVGPTVRVMSSQGVLREFRGYPIWTGWLYVGFIATRSLTVLLSAVLLVALSFTFFNYLPDGITLTKYLIGTVVCFLTYSLLAVIINFLVKSNSGDYGFASVFYMGGLFLADVFFMLGQEGILYYFGFMFPLKPILLFMRGDGLDQILFLCIALAWFLVAFSILMFIMRSSFLSHSVGLRTS